MEGRTRLRFLISRLLLVLLSCDASRSLALGCKEPHSHECMKQLYSDEKRGRILETSLTRERLTNKLQIRDMDTYLARSPISVLCCRVYSQQAGTDGDMCGYLTSPAAEFLNTACLQG